MHCFSSARADSETLHQQYYPVLNWRCRLMQVDLYNGRKMVFFGKQCLVVSSIRWSGIFGLFISPCMCTCMHLDLPLTSCLLVSFISVFQCLLDFCHSGICLFAGWQADEDPPHSYSQVFYLKNVNGAYCIGHDIFRLSIHNA